MIAGAPVDSHQMCVSGLFDSLDYRMLGHRIDVVIAELPDNIGPLLIAIAEVKTVVMPLVGVVAVDIRLRPLAFTQRRKHAINPVLLRSIQDGIDGQEVCVVQGADIPAGSHHEVVISVPGGWVIHPGSARSLPVDTNPQQVEALPLTISHKTVKLCCRQFNGQILRTVSHQKKRVARCVLQVSVITADGGLGEVSKNLEDTRAQNG